MARSSSVVEIVEQKRRTGKDRARHEPARPLVPDGSACFTPVDPVDPAVLCREFGQLLAELRPQSELDPFSNPILLLAVQINRRLDSASLSLSALEQAIQQLSASSFVVRVERFAHYLGEHRRARNEARLKELFRGLTVDPASSETVPFEAFQERVGRARFGVVITAHPTFALAKGLQQILVELALDLDPDGASGDTARRSELIERIGRTEHRPDHPLDLAEEHRQSLAVLGHLHDVLDAVHRLLFEVAEAAYPERWTELRPNLISLASWVGYDLDGRSDIPWTTTFAARLEVQRSQLQRYRSSVTAIRARADLPAAVADLLDLLEARLALAIKQAGDEIEVFAVRPDDATGAWGGRLAELARAMHAGQDARLVEAAALARLVERAVAAGESSDLRRDLCVLRTEIANHGLGLAQTHTRLNARQLHNAIRKTIGMDHAADDPSHRLSYLTSIAALIDGVEPVTVNFGSLLAEKATAKRVFMIIAQLLKYVDAEQPIRFLIAECETGFTLLCALYFAKLFGVEAKVELSPLFETETGLDQGATVIAEALAAESFRDYVRRHGRICIQTGYSDAGRQLGQIAAAHAIERLRLAVAEVLTQHDLTGVELVIFDTHGESIGRGGHPESFATRLDYLDPPACRRAFAERGLPYKQEVSFQGGDGYLPFINQDVAFAAVTRMLENGFAAPEEGGDPFYDEVDYVHEFFSVIRRFNGRIMADPCYGALLSAHGANLLHRTGSRPVQRQHESWSGEINLEHPGQLRAIPHNAILQQLGFLANVIGGVGQAVAKDPERFQRLYQDSPRFRRLMTMVEHAFKYSDLTVLKAYIDLFDPGLWLARAAQRGDGERAEELRALADAMERAALHERLSQIWRSFIRDYLDLAAALREHRRRARRAGDEPIVVDAAARDLMHQLHAVRIALLQELYLRAVHLPDFSPRHDITREGLLAALIHLDVEPALAKLTEIFPILDVDDQGLDFGEPATYRSAENQSYAQEHVQIFQPIGKIYALIRRIGTAVVHNVGAFG